MFALAGFLGCAQIRPEDVDAGVFDFARGIDLAPPNDLTSCVPTGAPCNTGSPGMCATGHQECISGLSTCVHDVTMQPCYTGPAGTSGKGICRGGMQSCMGTLGACVGEVTPAARENCFNDIDDDCTGVVEDGCPLSLSVGTPRALAAQGGAGGGAASARCPAGTIVIHSRFSFVYTDATAQGIQIFCATPTLTRGATTYSLGVTNKVTGPTLTGSGPSMPPDSGDPNSGNIDCGTIGLVVGWRSPIYASDYVYGMGMYCASGAASLAADNRLTITFTPTANGNAWFYAGGNLAQLDCASNEALVGYDGRVGAWMDQLQPICAPLVTVYK